MDLAKIKDRTAQLTINLGGDEDNRIVLEYRPGALTPARLQAATNTDDNMGETLSLLSDMISSWDVTQDGKPYPTTEEALSELDMPLLNTILDRIVDDTRPKSGRENGAQPVAEARRPIRRNA